MLEMASSETSAPLLVTPSNPRPENAVAGWLTLHDGKRVRFARYAATGRPLKGTVVIFTGRNECIEKYHETIGDLSERGFGSAIMDWRGQGLSDRMIRNPHRGYIDSFDQYVGDVEPLFEQVVLPDCRGPYYLLAHSMGALVALMAAPRLVNRVRRMVLSTPLLDFAGLAVSTDTLYRVSTVMCALGMGSLRIGGSNRWEPGLPATSTLTSDPVRHARNVELFTRHPALALGAPAAAWIRAACMAMRAAETPEFRGNLRIPTLFVAAGNDEVVSTSHIERYAQGLRSGSLVTIDGARHEILQEADRYREQFLAAFDAFVPGSG